jgi:hypothetical protein
MFYTSLLGVVHVYAHCPHHGRTLLIGIKYATHIISETFKLSENLVPYTIGTVGSQLNECRLLRFKLDSSEPEGSAAKDSSSEGQALGSGMHGVGFGLNCNLKASIGMGVGDVVVRLNLHACLLKINPQHLLPLALVLVMNIERLRLHGEHLYWQWNPLPPVAVRSPRQCGG